jgi:chemotaxis protein MotB
MAGKGGGGSWKVAYADFVTAMMAFFLVMWIGSQDQKTKQAVANYFVDPSGVSKRPASPGAIMQTPTYGSVPQAESAAMGKGRSSYTEAAEHSPLTKVVSDGLLADSSTLDYWRIEANRHRDEAARSREVIELRRPIAEVAAETLAKKMKEEHLRKIPPQAKGVYQDVLFSGFADVNWREIAEDILGRS